MKKPDVLVAHTTPARKHKSHEQRGKATRLKSRLLVIAVAIAALVAVPFAPGSAAIASNQEQSRPSHGNEPTLPVLDKLVGGGATSTATLIPEMAPLLHQINTRRVRTINEDLPTNIVAITPDGDPVEDWSNPIDVAYYQYAKDHGFIPRVIIGQYLPNLLALKSPDGRMYGPSSWETYDKYIWDFLDHVTQDLDFKVTEWEVGNEMNAPQYNWVGPVKPSGIWDMEVGFNSYMTLYSHISAVVKAYKEAHPDLKITLGGPAVATIGIMESDPSINWGVQFVKRCAADRQLICDFVSGHFYGTRRSGSDFTASINLIKNAMVESGRSMPISISEWGPDWRGDDALLNLGAPAGAFAMEFLNTLRNNGVDDAIFLLFVRNEPSRNPDYPEMFEIDGTPQNTYHALKLMSDLANLKGTETSCSSNVPTVKCLAVQQGSSVHVIMWDINWQNAALTEAEYTNPPEVDVQLSISTTHPTRSRALGVHSFTVNNSQPTNSSGLTVSSDGGTIQVSELQMHLGDYGAFVVRPGKSHTAG